MRNLIGTSPQTVIRYIGEDRYLRHCGFIAGRGSSPRAAYELGAVWAGDNDMYSYWSRGLPFDSDRFLRSLSLWTPYRDRCLFVNAPDVILDGAATIAQFEYWRNIIRDFGFPVAITLQPGGESEIMDILPLCDAVFLGGLDPWREQDDTIALVQKIAKVKHVHVGRAGTKRQIARAQYMGARSFDSTGFARWPVNVKKWLSHRGIQYRLL